MNSGLISIVIVIVIGCRLVPLFFLKSGTLIFDFFGIIITDGGHILPSFCLRSGFALGSLCLRSGSTPKSGGKGYSKRDEKDLNLTNTFVK